MTLVLRWRAERSGPLLGWAGPAIRPRSASAVAARIGPRGPAGLGTLGVFTLAELHELYPADLNDGSFAVASDIGAGVVVWAVNGQWTSHAPSLAALDAAADALDTRADGLDAAAAALTAALAAEAQARSNSDIEAANRLDAAEQMLGADPGDLTLLFDNGLV